MELYEIKQGLDKYQQKLNQLRQVLQLPLKLALIEELEHRQLADDFWNDQRQAKKLIAQLNIEKDLVSSFTKLDQHLTTLVSDFQGLKDSFDVEMLELFEDDYHSFEQQFSEFEIKILLSGDNDHSDCIIEIHPGAGGTESQDWANMLYRMYNRFANRHGYKLTVVDYQDGDTAGIKSVTFQLSGDLAYGYLKCERGVHRLVRISPFDSSGRRHTSFASVEVTPVFDDDIIVEIDANDLLIETHRASGAGGQHVNKTDSAVRLTHLPSGIVVNVQSERSQLNNREQAMKILKGRLYQRMLEEQEAKLAAMKGDQKSIEWGSQIRSYVFCPYTMVKDHRTNFEVSAVDKVMDGDIDDFIYHFLKDQVSVEGS
jgi:peptide chain release factor 2